MANRNFFPRNDAEFNQFNKNIIQYVAVKSGGSTPAWTHISKKDRDEMDAHYTAWYTAYGLTLKPHTPVETGEKNRTKKAMETAMREFINRYLRYSAAVTDADREYMGIPNKDTVRTHHDVVEEEVEFYLEDKGVSRVRAHFKVKGAEHKAKPYGFNGAVVVWKVGGDEPEVPEELTEHQLASRTPFTMTFSAADRGKKVYVAMRWENGKSVLGPWSDIQWAIVP